MTPDYKELMKAKTTEALQTALLKLFHDQTFHLDWRDPDGKLLYVKSPKQSDSECREKESEGMKIYPGVEWGCLLAFVMPKDHSTPREVLAGIKDPTKQILKIGRGDGVLLEYKDEQFCSRGSKFCLDETYSGCEIFFTVNDIVIHDKTQLSFPGCKEERKKIESDIDKKVAAYYEECCTRMIDPQPYAIWYLDNRGSFTVSILEDDP